jgi:hypothetical protein
MKGVALHPIYLTTRWLSGRWYIQSGYLDERVHHTLGGIGRAGCDCIRLLRTALNLKFRSCLFLEFSITYVWTRLDLRKTRHGKVRIRGGPCNKTSGHLKDVAASGLSLYPPLIRKHGRQTWSLGSAEHPDRADFGGRIRRMERYQDTVGAHSTISLHFPDKRNLILCFQGR